MTQLRHIIGILTGIIGFSIFIYWWPQGYVSDDWILPLLLVSIFCMRDVK